MNSLASLKSRLTWFTKPKNLIRFDFVGAVATSVSTGLLLTMVIDTGLPTWILYALSGTAAAFACFDVMALVAWPNQRWPLTVVGLLNLLYCIGAMVISSVYLPQMTKIGFIYFSIECAIVIPLAVFELVVARHKPAIDD